MSSQTEVIDAADNRSVEEATKDQDASTGIISDDIKSLDANRYATKKTVGQGMLDIALLTSNASQLKYVLQVGINHEFYTLLVVLISASIVLQLIVGLLLVVIGGLDLNSHSDQPSALILNDIIFIFIFIISAVNIVISAFGIEYSNSPLILERLARLRVNASAGALALIVSYLDGSGSREEAAGPPRNKMADWLYHTSVAFMTAVVFCDVIKMTFGLDPALSEKDYFGTKTDVISAVVNIVLSTIFNINHTNDHRHAEMLNNISLVFKVLGIVDNIVVSVLFSMHVDNNQEALRNITIPALPILPSL